MASDSYLSFAYEILRRARRPLSAKEILESAYILGVVPKHLHGKTQHKTLTARISSDILVHKERSLFFRPWPGRFFLREFIADKTLPSEYRQPIVAKRRSRQLRKEYAAYLPDRALAETSKSEFISKKQLAPLLSGAYPLYQRDGSVSDEHYGIWTLALVRKKRRTLIYDKGSFIDGRRLFDEPRSLSFCAPLTQSDRTLFDKTFHGALASAITTVSVDLDLEYSPAFQMIETRSKLVGAFKSHVAGRKFLVILCDIVIPEDYRIYSRRLAINNVQWIQTGEVSTMRSFLDPWSLRAASLVL